MPWHSHSWPLRLVPGRAHSVDPADRLESVGLAHAGLVVEAAIDSAVACHAHSMRGVVWLIGRIAGWLQLGRTIDVVGESVPGECDRYVSGVRAGLAGANACLTCWRCSNFVAIGDPAALGANADGHSCGPLSSSAPHLAHRITPTADGHAHHCFFMA